MRRHVLLVSDDDLDARERLHLDWARRHQHPVSLRGQCWRVQATEKTDGKVVYRLWSLPPTFCYGTLPVAEDEAMSPTPRRPRAR